MQMLTKVDWRPWVARTFAQLQVGFKMRLQNTG